MERRQQDQAVQISLGGVSLGLGENWRQFALLVAVNVFVGGMIGLERSILPRRASSV